MTKICLKQFSSKSRGCFHRMAILDPNSIDPGEVLSRYIFSGDHYSISDRRVKYTAFMPRSDDLRTSVYRTSGLADHEVWRIGESVGQTRHRDLHGRGDLIASDVIEQSLDIDPDNDPPRHADIIGWPQDKHKRQEIALLLASRATLELRN